MKVLSKLQAPAIAGVIREKTAKDAIAEIKNCNGYRWRKNFRTGLALMERE